MAFAVVAQRFCIAVFILVGVAVTTPPDPTEDAVDQIPPLHPVKESTHEDAEQHLVNKKSQKEGSEDKKKIQEGADGHDAGSLAQGIHKAPEKFHKEEEKRANAAPKKAAVIQKNAGGDLVIEKKADPKDIKKELRITPTKLMAILFFMLWMSFFLTGFCCLFHVQTPQTYEEKCLVLNKQY